MHRFQTPDTIPCLQPYYINSDFQGLSTPLYMREDMSEL